MSGANLIIAAASTAPIVAPSHDVTVLVLGSILILIATLLTGFGPTRPSTLFAGLGVALLGVAVWFL